MMNIKKILVATDFSETSDAAVAYARQLAATFGSALHVVHVAGNVVASAIGLEEYSTDFVGLQRELEDAARKHLEATITETDRKTLAAKLVLLTSNNPAQAIASYARDEGIDLVVAGTHGRGGMQHLLLGSVAERVVRTAPCPVLTVRHAAVRSKPLAAEEVGAHV